MVVFSLSKHLSHKATHVEKPDGGRDGLGWLFDFSVSSCVCILRMRERDGGKERERERESIFCLFTLTFVLELFLHCYSTIYRHMTLFLLIYFTFVYYLFHLFWQCKHMFPMPINPLKLKFRARTSCGEGRWGQTGFEVTEDGGEVDDCQGLMNLPHSHVWS
jgi:hypothetical protein